MIYFIGGMTTTTWEKWKILCSFLSFTYFSLLLYAKSVNIKSTRFLQIIDFKGILNKVVKHKVNKNQLSLIHQLQTEI